MYDSNEARRARDGDAALTRRGEHVELRAAAAGLPPAAEEVPSLVPYADDAKKALELTFREALRLGHNYIGTEHLVLALLDLEDGVGPLSDCGLAKPDVEQRVVATLAAMTG